MLGQGLSDPGQLIYIIIALLSAITVHEYAHGRVALHFGDGTAKMYGRLTLNPIKHLDPIGGLMLLLAGFGWAKPVPVNPRNYSNYKKGTLWVSFAGPLSNIALAVSVAIVIRVLGFLPISSLAWPMIWGLGGMMITYNIYFAIFNMIPFPPLDGSKILGVLLPPKYAFQYSNFINQFEMYGLLVLILLTTTGLFRIIIDPFYYLFMTVIQFIIG